MQGDLDSLFEQNRSKLKKVFAKHFPSKEGKVNYAEFCKFCKNARIHPDLMSTLELKRTVVRLTSITQTNKIQLSYAQFEHVLKHIAVATFNSTIPLDEKLRMLILHMRNPVKQEYQVSLHCSSGDLPPSHSSDLEESQEAPRETLRVTLDLSKTPRTQKLLSFSPSRNTPNPKLDSPKVSPRTKVPLFHVTLDKQKQRQPRSVRLADKAHIRTASAGTHTLQSPRFGTETKPVSDSPTQDLRRALTALQSALPPARPRPDVLQAERQQGFIRTTTASWFTRDFVLRMMLRAWRDYAHRRHLARVKSAVA